MKGTLTALGVFCWLVAARLLEAAVTATHQTQALICWSLVIAGAYAGWSLIRRARRPEYRHVPPAQSTRDWDSYIAPKAPTPKPVRPDSGREADARSMDFRRTDNEAADLPAISVKSEVSGDARPLLSDQSALQTSAMPVSAHQRGSVVRDDINAAIGATPANVQATLGSSGRGALKFLDEHLPKDEVVHHVISAGVEPLRTLENCALVVTDLRLLFVNPLPQVLAWDLTQIANVHASLGFMVTTHGGGQTHLGINSGWGDTFVARLQVAMAIATLRATA